MDLLESLLYRVGDFGKLDLRDYIETVVGHNLFAVGGLPRGGFGAAEIQTQDG